MIHLLTSLGYGGATVTTGGGERETGGGGKIR